jgi:hypothetical protein
MGWTSYHVPMEYKNGRHVVDRKAECDKLMNSDMVTWDESNKVIGKYEVLRSVTNGATYYAAVKKTKFATETEPETSVVFAAIILTSVNTKDYFNFAYKDMDETCGPCECKCPKYILDLLSPTDNEYANNWRAACYANNTHGKNALGKLPVGTVIKYKRHDGKEITVYKHRAAYQFKRPFWMLIDNSGYISAKYIPKDFEVIKKGEC